MVTRQELAVQLDLAQRERSRLQKIFAQGSDSMQRAMILQFRAAQEKVNELSEQLNNFVTPTNEEISIIPQESINQLENQQPLALGTTETQQVTQDNTLRNALLIGGALLLLL